MKQRKTNPGEETSIEMTIALVALLIMFLETWIGTQGLALFFR